MRRPPGLDVAAGRKIRGTGRHLCVDLVFESMKTALKVMGGIFATLLAAIAIFYFGWLSPPSAESVCENVVKVSRAELEAKGETAAEDTLSQLEERCMSAASKEPEFGRGPWVKRLKCMRDAKNYAVLQECDEIRSL